MSLSETMLCMPASDPPPLNCIILYACMCVKHLPYQRMLPPNLNNCKTIQNARLPTPFHVLSVGLEIKIRVLQCGMPGLPTLNPSWQVISTPGLHACAPLPELPPPPPPSQF